VTHVLFLPREEGQGLVEYALILVLVAIVVIAILLILGPAVGNVFSNIVANV
jgi:pilus assembly protein Flp/PilA